MTQRAPWTSLSEEAADSLRELGWTKERWEDASLPLATPLSFEEWIMEIARKIEVSPLLLQWWNSLTDQGRYFQYLDYVDLFWADQRGQQK